MVTAKTTAAIVNGRLQVQIDLQMKGDAPGHPFRGNQWTGGGSGVVTVDDTEEEEEEEEETEEEEEDGPGTTPWGTPSTIERRQITLDQIAGHAMDMEEEASPLKPGDEDEPVIVEVGQNGKIIEIVDGYHRTAGYRLYAKENGIPFSELKINVIASDDEYLNSNASQPGGDQREFLDQIYQRVTR
jgi:hypothetical protein